MKYIKNYKIITEKIHNENLKHDEIFIDIINNPPEYVIKYIKDKYFDINYQDDFGYTPLMVAITRNKKKLVKELIKNNVDVNITENGGNTALMIAVDKRYINIVKLLLDSYKNININNQNELGDTALMWACFNFDYKLVELLLNAGADITIKNYDDKLLAFDYLNDTNIEKIKKYFPKQYNQYQILKDLKKYNL